MKRGQRIFIVAVLFILAGCAVSPSTADKLAGAWAGSSESTDGSAANVEIEFTDDGKMVAVISPGLLDVVQTGTWRIDDRGYLCTIIGIDGDEGGCATVEFIGGSAVKITGNTTGTVLSLKRK